MCQHEDIVDRVLAFSWGVYCHYYLSTWSLPCRYLLLVISHRINALERRARLRCIGWRLGGWARVAICTSPQNQHSTKYVGILITPCSYST